jgi:hypothetical protein
MGHMDVVEAKREDSTTDPFMLTVRAAIIASRRRRTGTGITPGADDRTQGGGLQTDPRRIIFTGDETNGIGANKGRKRVDEPAPDTPRIWPLNADGGGGGVTPAGRPIGFTMQTAGNCWLH